MNTSDVLYRAADRIQRDGLWRGAAGGESGSVCASNAISRAGSRPFGEAHKALLSYLGEAVISPAPIFRWNDAPGRTAAEVVETLRACAVIAAARESVAAYALGAVGAA